MTRLNSLSTETRVASSTLAASIGVLALNLIGGIALARGLGVDGRGQVAALVLWAAISVDLAMVGTNASTTYHVARYRSDRSPIVSLLRRATPVMALAGVAVFCLFVATSPRSWLITAVLAFAAYVPARIIYEQVISFVQGDQGFAQYNLSRVLLAGAQTALFAVAVLTGVLTVTVAGIGYLTGLIVGLGILRGRRRDRSTKELPVSPSFGFALGAFWSYAVRNWFAVLAARGNSSIDLFILSLLATTSTLGLYAVSVSAASVLTLAGAAAGIVALPRLAAAKGDQESAAIYRKLLLFTILGTASLAAVLLVTADFIVPLVFGEDFRSAVPIVRILAVGYVGVSLASFAAAVLRSRNRPGVVAVAQALGGAVTVTAALLLDPRSGTSVATASVLGFWCSAVIQTAVASRRVKHATDTSSHWSGR